MNGAVDPIVESDCKAKLLNYNWILICTDIS